MGPVRSACLREVSKKETFCDYQMPQLNLEMDNKPRSTYQLTNWQNVIRKDNAFSANSKDSWSFKKRQVHFLCSVLVFCHMAGFSSVGRTHCHPWEYKKHLRKRESHTQMIRINCHPMPCVGIWNHHENL